MIDHMITDFSWVVTMVTSDNQHCHLVVTCPVTVPPVKAIVIVGYLPYQITEVLQNAKQSWSLNDYMITEFSWVVTMVTGRALYWHLVVTCKVTVAMVKPIVIVAYLPNQITQN